MPDDNITAAPQFDPTPEGFKLTWEQSRPDLVVGLKEVGEASKAFKKAILAVRDPNNCAEMQEFAKAMDKVNVGIDLLNNIVGMMVDMHGMITHEIAPDRTSFGRSLLREVMSGRQH